MKKKKVVVSLVFLMVVLLLTITLVSAGWWSDFNNWFRNLFGFHEKLEEGLNGELKSLGIDGTNDYGSPDYPRICEEGEKRCELMPSRTANFRYSIKECQNNLWIDAENCEVNQECRDGACVCIEGEKRCYEKPARRGGGIIKGVEECHSGEWAEIERCEGSCLDGKCLNQKNMSKYSNREAFLISDNNWKDILPLVPATTWTGSEDCQEGYGTPENVCVYPTLIYHEEGEGFDADSIIYFMQQYSPNKVTIIGNTPQELDDLLIAAPELGAGLQIEQLQRINSEDYLSYWQKFEEVIYVEDNYELALLASTYASLINAPLIIHGTSLDKIETFSGKEVICIGSGSPSGSSCSKQYDLRTLQQKYVEKVNEIDTEKLNKFIVVNSRDIDFVGAINYVPRDLITEKSGDTMHYLFKKDSLIAPILASAKHEVIIPLSAEIDVGQSSISTFNSTCDFHNLGCNNLKQQIKDNVEGLAPYVQEDYANIGEHHEDFDIALYSEGSEEILFETPDDSIEPTIYDNKIAWIEVNTTYLYDESRPSTNKWLNIEDYSIFYYDTNTGLQEKIYSSGSKRLKDLLMHKDNLVWTENYKNITLFDLTSQTIEKIKRTSSVHSLHINDDYIIWMESNKLYGYNILTKEITTLRDAQVRYDLDLDGELLVWIEYSSPDCILYMMNLSDNSVVQIKKGNTYIYRVFISGSDIVWEEEKGTNRYYYHYNINTRNTNLFLQEEVRAGYGAVDFVLYDDKAYALEKYKWGSAERVDYNLISYNITTGQKEYLTNDFYIMSNREGLARFSNKFVYSKNNKKNERYLRDGYITFIGSPFAIPPYLTYFSMSEGFYYGPAEKLLLLDFYGNDRKPDLAFGRIMGFTTSDVSSYVSRAVFYHDLNFNNKLFFASSRALGDIFEAEFINSVEPIFSDAGYEVTKDLQEAERYDGTGTANLWENNDLVYYFDHAQENHVGIYSNEIPYLNSTFIDTMACATCFISSHFYADRAFSDSFCLNAFRKGAIAYLGSTTLTKGYETHRYALQEAYYNNLPIGLAFVKHTKMAEDTLIGDPTLVIGKKLLNEPLLEN